MEGDRDKSGQGTPTTANPLELALERVRDTGDTDVVHRFLRKQEGLVEAQAREARARVSQLGRERWRDIIISLIGICILATGGLFVWDATQARGVAIEPFRVPPDMDTRGMDGVVVATQVMDQLFAMQSATVSIRAPSTYSNNWGDDIAVEIPNTGVTIGDLRSSLRAWFGQQVRLSGEVVRLPDGQLALNVRVGAGFGERFTGAESEFDGLVRQAAEAVYRQTQPYRYSIWLRNDGRADEAKQIVDQLASSPKAEDRLWAINTLGARNLDPATSISLYERGLRIDPEFTPFLYNAAITSSALGRDGEALSYLTRLFKAEHVVRRQINPERIDQILLSAGEQYALLQRDMPKACELAQLQVDAVADRGSSMLVPINVVQCLAASRDIPAARQFLAEAGLNDPESMEAHAAQLSPDIEVASGIAAALDDWDEAYTILKGVLADLLDTDREDGLLVDATVLAKANLGVVAARTGRIGEAREVVAGLPVECTVCVRARGVIEAHAGDSDATHRYFALARGQAAKAPDTHSEYAEALFILKDWRGAIAQAQQAAALAPRWADPHKLWADALMEMGEYRGAAARYSEAEKLAPNWGALKLALGKAQAAAGNIKAAREAWAKAAALPLLPADQAETRQLLATAL